MKNSLLQAKSVGLFLCDLLLFLVIGATTYNYLRECALFVLQDIVNPILEAVKCSLVHGIIAQNHTISIPDHIASHELGVFLAYCVP